MKNAMALIAGLNEVIASHENVDQRRTIRARVKQGKPANDQGFAISLDGTNGARIEIRAFGVTIVAIAVATSKQVLFNIIRAIRAWCEEIISELAPQQQQLAA